MIKFTVKNLRGFSTRKFHHMALVLKDLTLKGIRRSQTRTYLWVKWLTKITWQMSEKRRLPFPRPYTTFCEISEQCTYVSILKLSPLFLPTHRLSICTLTYLHKWCRVEFSGSRAHSVVSLFAVTMKSLKSCPLGTFLLRLSSLRTWSLLRCKLLFFCIDLSNQFLSSSIPFQKY